MTEYVSTIGLEFHAELKTKTKIFCSCPTDFAGDANTHVCPICLGLPGVLPVLNREAVRLAVKAGLALNCSISRISKFDRKNYFYPDLPKGYQVTQYPLPICKGGWLEIATEIPARSEASSSRRGQADGAGVSPYTSSTAAQTATTKCAAYGRAGEKAIRINRIHMEEDAGKLVHSGDHIADSSYSLPDYNRAAVPLIEIVTEPDMCGAAEARAFAETLKLTLEYAGVSDVKMEQGSLRCDVNISIRPEDAAELGVKVEIKNLNSFRSMQRAIEYEIERQRGLIERGGRVVQETRLWDEAVGETRSMRSKENDHDYRYFPEPDLPPVVISEEWLAQIAASLPELPQARLKRLQDELGLSAYDAGQIVGNMPLARFFDDSVAKGGEAKTVANWLLGDIARLMNSGEGAADSVPVDAGEFVYLLTELAKGAINNNSAKVVLEDLFGSDKKAADVIAAHGFAQISDSSLLADAVQAVIAEHPQPVADYRSGKKQAAGFLVGQVMKRTQGQANPAMVRELLEQMLAE